MANGGAPAGRLRVDAKDFFAGALFIVIAAVFATSALRNLSLGSARAMGPGYFPLMMTVPLAGIGLAIILRAIGRPTEPVEFVSPRSLLLILAAPAAFALSIGRLGFIFALAATVLIAGFASRMMTARFAVALAVFMTGLCVLIFHYLLKMPVLLIGPWLGGG